MRVLCLLSTKGYGVAFDNTKIRTGRRVVSGGMGNEYGI
jgi:hypothetical protein